jgi:hypothetical protein
MTFSKSMAWFALHGPFRGQSIAGHGQSKPLSQPKTGVFTAHFELGARKRGEKCRFSLISLYTGLCLFTVSMHLILMSITNKQRAVAYARAHQLPEANQVCVSGRLCATGPGIGPIGGDDWVWFLTDAEAAEVGLAVAARRVGETFLIDGETWHSIPA